MSFSDYSYRFRINFELFCSDLSVFDIPEFTGRYPFPTFLFTDFDRAKIYAGENGERFFSIVTGRFHPYVARRRSALARGSRGRVAVAAATRGRGRYLRGTPA
jgi:hypothetical protein